MAAKHYYSYYGQLAAEELGGAALTQKFAAPAAATPEERALFSSRPTIAALRQLSDLNLDYEFMVFAYHADDQLTRPGEFLELAKLTNGEGAPHLTVRAGKVAIQKNAFAPDVAYPLVFVPEEAAKFMAPEVVLGLSRQESEFNPRAFSHAGARGMMQLIPSTAQITARKEGLRYSRSALLDDPVYNMTLGSAHLSHLTSRFDGSLIMTFASYNAGPHRVDRWMREYGDPRIAAIDPVDWVELIPFSETRNYVQRVLENVQVYRGRLNNAPIPGRLSADLERGGVKNRTARAPKPAIIKISTAPTQALPPLPAPTVKRARDYVLDMRAAALAAAAQPQAAELQSVSAQAEPARRTSRRRNFRKSRRRAPANSSSVIAQAETLENAPPAVMALTETNAAGTRVTAAAPTIEETAQIAAAVTETIPAATTPAPVAPKPGAQTVAAEAVTKIVPAEKLLAGGKTTVTSNSVNIAVADNGTAVSTPATMAKSTPVATKKSPAPVTAAAQAPETATANQSMEAQIRQLREQTSDDATGQPLAPPVIAAIPTDMAPSEASAAEEQRTIFPPAFAAPAQRPVVVANALAAPAQNAVVEAATGDAQEEESEECRAYRAFLAEIAGDDAEAADLNAAMLNELQSGVCN